MTIDWWTLGLQAINFLVLVWLLWRFLYRPVREVIEKRKAMADEAFAKADKKTQEAEAARQGFADSQAKLAQDRQDLLKKVHEELEAERQKVLDAARNESESMIDAAQTAIAGERAAALDEMRSQAAALAADLAAGLLRKAGTNALSEVFLEELDKQLKALPAAELSRLKKDLAANAARVDIVTAEALKAGERTRWTARIEAALGGKIKAKFVADPAILGGAELRFPHAVLKFTWEDQLKKAEDELQGHETAP
jgi:F-type H+-transporting ATPase subunit b